jgi:glycine cleavage system H protein
MIPRHGTDTDGANASFCGANLSGYRQRAHGLFTCALFVCRELALNQRNFYYHPSGSGEAVSPDRTNHILQEAAMNIPTDLKYTPNDEWIKIEGAAGAVGISDYAQEQLSDIVFVEIVVVEGDIVKKGDICASVESVKAAADVYMPVSGTILAVNEALPDTPEMINTDPYGGAWMVKVKLSDPAELDSLLDAAAYEEKTSE